MVDDSNASDAEIIRVAYAEKVKEAFKVFAENVGVGQNETASKERFRRSLELLRKDRDLALEVTGGTGSDRAVVQGRANLTGTAEKAGEDFQISGYGLSAEDEALIEQALAGTTGLKPLRPRR
jgi:hypothetical protein